MIKSYIIDIAHPQAMRYRHYAGDYFEANDKICVIVCNQGDDIKNFGIAIHELVEAFLTRHRGIEEEVIFEFDKQYGDKEGEAGDDPSAPYFREHQFATKIERLIIEELGIKWEDYHVHSADELMK